MKVAQLFSAGLAFFNASVPERDDRTEDVLASFLTKGTIEMIATAFEYGLACANDTQSSLAGRPCSKKANPAINCWATFIKSLRDSRIGKHGRKRTAPSDSQHLSSILLVEATLDPRHFVLR
jgi:hypothetical protein